MIGATQPLGARPGRRAPRQNWGKFEAHKWGGFHRPLMLAPHRVGRTEAKPHDGTIITDKVNEMWGTEMTQTIIIREGRANVFVAVEHAKLGSHRHSCIAAAAGIAWPCGAHGPSFRDSCDE
jgi:hypothetical protein